VSGVPLDMTPNMVLRDDVNCAWEAEYSTDVSSVPSHKTPGMVLREVCNWAFKAVITRCI
jgi:hypothetical protein